MITRCITNNPMVIEKGYPNTKAISGNTLSVLLAVRVEIEKGCQLLTHPLTSSIRPDVSPYKTVLLTNPESKIDPESLNMINRAIVYTENLIKNNDKPVHWDEESLRDFQYVDFDIIQNLML